MAYVVYILKSLKTGRYYVGQTDNLERRLKEHNSGKVFSTRNGSPYEIIRKEKFVTRNEAYKRERAIKRYKGGDAFKKLIEYSGIV